MDPSFDNSLGGFSGNPNFSAGAPVGGAPAVSGSGAPVASGADAGGVTSIASGSNVGPISSGTGDIILTPSEGKKGRKGLIVGIIVGLILAVIGATLVLFATGVIKVGQSKEEKNKEFATILTERRDGILELTTLASGILEGKLSMRGFMLPEESYSERTQQLNDAFADYESLNRRVQDGPELSGVIEEIDLGANYSGLKDTMSRDLEKYRILKDVTIKIYEVFENRGEKKAVDALDEYEGMYSLAIYIDDFFSARVEADTGYIANNCEKNWTDACDNIERESERAFDEFVQNRTILTESYAAVLGDFVYSGDGSVSWYFDELYAAIGENYEE